MCLVSILVYEYGYFYRIGVLALLVYCLIIMTYCYAKLGYGILIECTALCEFATLFIDLISAMAQLFLNYY